MVQRLSYFKYFLVFSLQFYISPNFTPPVSLDYPPIHLTYLINFSRCVLFSCRLDRSNILQASLSLSLFCSVFFIPPRLLHYLIQLPPPLSLSLSLSLSLFLSLSLSLSLCTSLLLSVLPLSFSFFEA